MRSTTRTKPSSSIATMSPVRNQSAPPSSAGTNTASVSSGFFQYPENTCGPRTMSSPSAPGSRSRVGSSGSTTRTSVEGSGRPTVPALRLGATGFAISTGEHSESP